MTGETLSNSAMWVGVLANLQFLQETVQSDFFKSLVLVTGPILGILVSPKAGVMIDRHAKKTVMMWSSLVQLVSASLQVAAMYLHSLPLMVFGLLVLNAANSFYLPTLNSVIPMVVPQSVLVRANAAFTNVVTVTRIAATGIAGILLTLLPLYGMYLLAVLLFAIMFGIRYMLVFQEEVRDGKRENGNQISFFEVFSLLRTIPALILLVVSGTLVFLFLGGFNLLILKFSEVQQDAALKGILYTVEGISILIGGTLTKRLFSGGDLLRRNVMLLSGVALALFCMHFAGSKWFVISGFALFGLTLGMWLPTNGAIPQIIVPATIRGRYFAFQGMWNRSIFQFALVLTGALLDLIGLPMYMLVLSSVMLAGFLSLYAVAELRNIRVMTPAETDKQLEASA